MERTFRLAKRHRNLGMVCLIFFVLIGVASAYGMWSAAPPERRMVFGKPTGWIGNGGSGTKRMPALQSGIGTKENKQRD